MEIRYKGVFKKSVALKLIEEGFRVLDAKVNKESPTHVIFYFEDTKDFREEFTRISFEEKNKKFIK